MKTLLSHSPEETLKAARDLAGSLKPGSVLALTGSLGSGKTVLVKGIAQELGITEPVTSPTFTLISVYEGTMPLYHMDLYRLGSVEEFELLGVEEMLYGKGICAIEWSEKAIEILPDDTIFINFTILDSGEREISIRGCKE